MKKSVLLIHVCVLLTVERKLWHYFSGIYKLHVEWMVTSSTLDLFFAQRWKWGMTQSMACSWTPPAGICWSAPSPRRCSISPGTARNADTWPSSRWDASAWKKREQKKVLTSHRKSSQAKGEKKLWLFARGAPPPHLFTLDLPMQWINGLVSTCLERTIDSKVFLLYLNLLFQGHLIDSVGWNKSNTSDTSTSEILLGTSQGMVVSTSY